MAKRKTIDVARLIDMSNTYLASGNPMISDEMRLAVCSFISSILHETGNYKGFNYIGWSTGGCDKWRKDGCPDDTTPYLGNETKRYYHR